MLAFWVGSVVTGADGEASVDVTLPESLTTYRIMAVAADQRVAVRLGQREIRINKPVTLKPAFPRFLAVGDKALVRRRRQQPADGEGLGGGHDEESSIRRCSRCTGRPSRRVAVAAGGAAEVRFTGAARRRSAARASR